MLLLGFGRYQTGHKIVSLVVPNKAYGLLRWLIQPFVVLALRKDYEDALFVLKTMVVF